MMLLRVPVKAIGGVFCREPVPTPTTDTSNPYTIPSSTKDDDGFYESIRHVTMSGDQPGSSENAYIYPSAVYFVPVPPPLREKLHSGPVNVRTAASEPRSAVQDDDYLHP